MKLWKVSAGTAGVIGKKSVKNDCPPTTAYIMLGEKCRNNCVFCAQSHSSQAHASLLSRVTWPVQPVQETIAGIAAAYDRGHFKRACLQVVQRADSWPATVNAVAEIRKNSDIPVCIASHIENLEQAQGLIAAGADRICIALDAATRDVYHATKGGDWQQKWKLLQECAAAFPGKVTTHLIVGLGETEQEMVETLASCLEQGITVGLFAFTPVRGTAWAGQPPPPVGHYRRIQIAHYLLSKGYGREVIGFVQGKISVFAVKNLTGELADGKAFETSGCRDCNRPYYNERPGGIMYNYPRALTKAETLRAIAESQVAAVKEETLGEMAVY